MTEPIDTERAEHYTWGHVCDGWHLLRSEGLSVIEERMPSGASEQRHRHARSRQFFYCLDGELTMQFDDRTVVLPPRHGIEVPPSVPHQARNCGSGDVRFLVVSQPPSHGDRLT
ncbi:MAG: cupin domain-containing protein [Deltaproteobacteria bacterium]|nr:cupin domain-containing protein [Deltaproteobacteria bacterium]